MLLNDENDENNKKKRKSSRIFLGHCSMASEAPQVAA